MIISDISIRRPVLATVMSAVIVLIGLVSYTQLPLRELPKTDVPVVSVDTRYPGASAEVVESEVTTPLEDVLSGIEGIDFIESTSRAERSGISVQFKLTRDPDAAAADVRDRVGRVRGRLPDEIDEPVVQKQEADAQPFLWYAFASDRHDPMELTDIVDRQVKDRLQTVEGVSDIFFGGERRAAMRIWLDRGRMAAYNVTPQEVETAIRNQNIELPAGRIESDEREINVTTLTTLQTPEEFEDVILRIDEGYPVRLKDVARIEVAPENLRRITRSNGNEGVALGIIRQSTSNPLEVADSVNAELDRISEILPDGITIRTAYDSTIFISSSINAVFSTIVEAVLLVILVIFLFLRNFRATFIPLLTIPVSLIGVFGVLLATGFSVNRLTLLALVLAIGLVVDDAIVMLENIQRHIEEGKKPMKAAFDGSREVAFAIVAMTLTLAAVYLPILFTTGRTGKYFVEFAVTLAFAVLISGFVALTLTPSLCARILSDEGGRSAGFLGFMEKGMQQLSRGYQVLLRRLLGIRVIVLGIGLAVAASGYLAYAALPQTLSPLEDNSRFLIFWRGPVGATKEYSDKYMRQIEAIVADIPEVQTYFSSVGFTDVTTGVLFVNLETWGERERNVKEIVDGIRPQLNEITGGLVFPVLPQGLGSGFRDRPVDFVMQTTGSYDQLADAVDKVVLAAERHGGFEGVDVSLDLNKVEFKARPDRAKVADVGVGIDTISRTFEIMLGEREMSQYKRESEEYAVIAQVENVDRRDPEDLTNIYVRGRSGEMIQLSNLVTIEEDIVPKELTHFNKLRSATIQSGLSDDIAVREALEFLRLQVEQLDDEQIRYEFGGQSREFIESSGTIFIAFALAIAFIYLFLAAQFESFIDPFVILLSVPLAISGALMGLFILGGSLNIYSQIGLITLIGLISKHGILLVEFANQLQERGEEFYDAIVRAAALRLRPILMTTGAMVIGAFPLAIATGAGAESRNEMGYVIVSGLLVGTLFTLFVVPIVYSYLARRRTAVAQASEPAPSAAE